MPVGAGKSRFFLAPDVWRIQLHCAPFAVQRATADAVTPVPQVGVLKVIFMRSPINMHEQQMSKNARLIGYTLGAIVAAIAVAWKFFAR